MINLIVCTLLTSSFFLFFKYFEIYKVNTFQALVVNYAVAATIGTIFSGGISSHLFEVDNSWMYYAGALGFLFISIFFLMAKTAQKVSVAVSSVASKMSMIIPSVISIFLVKEVRDNFNWLNLVLLVASLASIVLVTYKKEESVGNNSWKGLVLVFVVFVGSGLVDTVLNLKEIHFPDSYISQHFPENEFSSTEFKKVFAVFCFLVAFIIGSLTFLFKREKIELKSIIAGVMLGVPNYFSIYFLQQTLSSFGGNGAFVFPVMNIGIILISALMAFILFKEKLTAINLAGIGIAVISLCLLVI